ncbi:MAG: AAA family ATPase [Anaerolineae bacterium]|nr:AAA family ATPase [Anaerolineae bacterium]
MKVRIWGTRGSIPTPISPWEIEQKIYRAISNMPAMDITDPEAIQAYVKGLPPLQRGTAGGNTACVEVQAAGELLVLDAGSGFHQLGYELLKGLFGQGKGTLHLFISHLHWDHIQGFPMFRPAFVPGNRIFIYGGHELESIFVAQQHPRTWPVSLSYMRADIQFIQIQPGEPLTIGNVQVNMIKNAHPGDAYSYRIEDQHSILVYASDAEYKQLDDASVQPHIEFFRNADALIFDTQYTLKESWEKVDWGHSSAMIGVDLARAAGVKKLYLFHHDPTYSDDMLEDMLATAVTYQEQDNTLPKCEIDIMYEGMTFDLTPPGAVDLQFANNGETAILTLTSVFDARGMDQLAQQLARLDKEDAAASSIIDLSQVEILTTASLKFLVALDRERQGTLVLAGPSDSVQKVIRLGGYADFFAIYPTVETALAAVNARETLNLPGQVIKNRYRIENHIGAGHLGTVLKATDLEEIRTVALKVLSPTFSEETISHFLRQARRIMGLTHPNIIKVWSWDRDGERVFGTETFINGPTLEEILTQYISLRSPPPSAATTSHFFPDTLPLPISQTLDIAIDIAAALDHAHHRGVILGDLKPENIFVVMDTERGRPIAKLSGFGLGRLVEGRNLLNTPKLFLTADYLAPEQILGQPLDARTDLYALGVILYQLTTGHLPFEAPDLPLLSLSGVATSWVEKNASSRTDTIPGNEMPLKNDTPNDVALAVMQAHLNQVPRSPRALNPHISITLEHLILKLLAQNPNDRYASAQQVRRILSSLSAHVESVISPQLPLLVGREKPLRALLSCWEEARNGHGQLAFITGEPGIGKTRLTQQVALQCQPPVLLIAHCQKLESAPPYQLITEVLRNYFATVPPEFFDEKTRQLISNFARLIPDIDQMLPDLYIPPPLEAKQEQLRLMTHVTRFIEQATQERPWLLILEDLHRADQDSLNLLLYLGRHLPSIPLFIIGTYCDMDLDPEHPLLETLRGLRSHPTYRHFPLTRLRYEEVNHILTYIWQRSVPPDLVEKIYQRTAGNPFYVEEVAKGLEDEGLVPPYGISSTNTSRMERHSEMARHLSALKEIRLPQSAHEAVLRRVGYLSTGTQALLRQAAVLGQTFNFKDLYEMSGLSEWKVLEHLDEALERQLVEETGHSEMGHHSAIGQAKMERDAHLRFPQAEIQYVLYADLGPLRRRILHRKAGEALEQRAGTELTRLAETLAYHFGEAGEIEKSLKYGMLAAMQAQKSYAHDAALSWYRRVLETLETEEAIKVINSSFAGLCLQAHTSLGEVLTLIGHYEEALQHYTLAYSLAESGTAQVFPSSKQQPFPSLPDLCYKIASVYELRDEYDQVLTWLEKGLTFLKEMVPSVEAAHIYILGSRVFYHRGENDNAAMWCRKGLEIASQIDSYEGRQALGKSLYNLAGINVRGGDFQAAVQYGLESVQVYAQIEDPGGQANAYNNLAIAYVYQGDWERAGDAYFQSWTIKQEIGDIYGQAMSGNNLANIHFKRGEWEQAASLYEQHLTIWEQIGVPRGEAMTLINLAHVYIYQQKLEQARVYLTRAQSLLVDAGSKVYLSELERVWGKLELTEGNFDPALQHVLHAIALAQASNAPLEEGLSQRIAGEIYMARGEFEAALAALHAGLHILCNLQSNYEIGLIKTSLARLGIETGLIPSQQIRIYLTQAIEIFKELGAQADLSIARDLALLVAQPADHF